MSKATRLYFIAILPPKPLYTKLRLIQHEIKSKFGCVQALKPPVHITLQAPFKQPESFEKQLMTSLEKLCTTTKPFNVEIDGFGTFSPHTIYAKPLKTEGLMNFRESLIQLLEDQFGFTNEEIGFRDFNPHFTVAYRDLKADYPKIWEEFKNRTFNGNFEVSEIHLLKHNYRFWEVMNSFNLR